MTKKRNYRPSVNGLEQRLALNGTMGAAGLLSHGGHGVAEVRTAPMAHHGGHAHGGHAHGGHAHGGHHHR